MPISLSRRSLSNVLKTEVRSPHYFFTTDGWKEINLTGAPDKVFREKIVSAEGEKGETGRELPRISVKPDVLLLKTLNKIEECREAEHLSELGKAEKVGGKDSLEEQEAEEDTENWSNEEELVHPICNFKHVRFEPDFEINTDTASEEIEFGSEEEEYTDDKERGEEESIGEEKAEPPNLPKDTEESQIFRRRRHKHFLDTKIKEVFFDVPIDPPAEVPCKDEWKAFRDAVHSAIEQRDSCNKALMMKAEWRKQWHEYKTKKQKDSNEKMERMRVLVKDDFDDDDSSDSSSLDKEFFPEPEGTPEQADLGVSQSMVTQAGSMSSNESRELKQARRSSFVKSPEIDQNDVKNPSEKTDLTGDYKIKVDPCSVSDKTLLFSLDRIRTEGGSNRETVSMNSTKSTSSESFLKIISSSTSMTTMAGSKEFLPEPYYDQMYDYYGESYDGLMKMPLYHLDEDATVQQISKQLSESSKGDEEIEVEEKTIDQSEPEKGVSDSGSFYHAPSLLQDFDMTAEKTPTITKSSIPSIPVKHKSKKENRFEMLKEKFQFFTHDADGVITLVPRKDIDESYKANLKKYYHLCKHRQGLKLLKTKEDSSSLDESQEELTHIEEEEESSQVLSPFAKCFTEINAIRKQQSEIRRQQVAKIIEDDRAYFHMKYLENEDDMFGESGNSLVCDYKMEMLMMDLNEYAEEDTRVMPKNEENLYKLSSISEECHDYAPTYISDSSLQEVDFDDIHSRYSLVDTTTHYTPEMQWKQMLYIKVIKNLLKRTVNVAGEQMNIGEVLGPEKVDELLKFRTQSISITRDARIDSQDYFKAMDIHAEKSTRSEIYGEETEGECNAKVVTAKDWYSMGDKKNVMNRLLNHMVDDILNGPKTSNAKKIFNILEIAAEIERSRTSANEDKLLPDKNIITYREKTLKFLDSEKGLFEDQMDKQFAIIEVQKEEQLEEEEEEGEENDGMMETEISSEKVFYPYQVVTTKGPVKFPSQGKYFGNWNKIGMESCGVYETPDGVLIECKMKDGMFDGDTRVTFPNGTVIKGTYVNNEFYPKTYTFKDGLQYEGSNWKYLQWPDRRFWSEIINKVEGRDQPSNDIPTRKIPKGCIDTGEGFYCPLTKYIHHPRTLKPIRIPTEEEEERITFAYRKGWDECVSHSHHLHEYGFQQVPKEKNPFTHKVIPPEDYKKREMKEKGAMLDKRLSLKPANPSGQEILESITSIFSPGPDMGGRFSLATKRPQQRMNVMRDKIIQRRQSNTQKFKGICYDTFSNCKLIN